MIRAMSQVQQRFAEKGFALFDLDQTLIPWDTQLLFANWIIRKQPLRRAYLLLFAPFLPLSSILGAGGMKRIFVSYLFGMTREEIDAEVREFVDWLLSKYVYGEILAELEKHKAEGRVVILTSASPEIYVKEIGSRLGCDYAFGTRFEFAERMPLFPDLVDENNKGAQKLVRICEELGELPIMHEESFAYSDSSADLPMLRICKHVTMVNPTAGLRAEGEMKQWTLSEPSRPTNGKVAFAIACVKQALGVFGL